HLVGPAERLGAEGSGVVGRVDLVVPGEYGAHAGEAGDVDQGRSRVGRDGSEDLADLDARSPERGLRLGVAGEAARALGLVPVGGFAADAPPGGEAPGPLPAADRVQALVVGLDEVGGRVAAIVEVLPADVYDHDLLLPLRSL